MTYRTLEKILHADPTADRFSSAKAAYQERFNSESSFRTGIQLKNGELFLAVPRELTLAHERMLTYERRVSALWKSLPPVALHDYVSGLIMDEVVYSNGMEGVRSTRKEIAQALEEAQRDSSALPGAASKEHAPFVEFAKLYLGITDNPQAPATLQDIRSIFEAVVQDSIDKRDVPRSSLFRTGPIVIEDARGRIKHEGVEPQRIEPMLRQWLRLSFTEDIPETLSALLCHFLFGYIHPFYDGNGRTGRYLLALQLSRSLSEPTVLSLSRTIAEHKNTYYKAFDEVEKPLNHAEATPFVLSMLDLINEAQEYLVVDLEEKRSQLEGLSSVILGIEPCLPAQSAKALLYILQLHLMSGVDEIRQADVSASIKVSIPTARSALRDLVARKILVQISQRPPVFRLTEQATKLITR